MKLDIALTKNDNGIYDITINDTGDLESTDGLDSALLLSIFCEKRADESEVIKPEFRRGDWSNELNPTLNYEVGSKLWLLDSARANQESIDNGIDYINDGLKWLIDDNIVKDVNTIGELTSRGILFTIAITKQDDSIDKKLIEVFENTRAV